MFVFTSHREIHSFFKDKKGSVGLVPTMGALHQGHASLVEKATLENEWVIVSIFVNPTQFNNQEDLAKYPKTLTKDQQRLAPFKEKLLLYVPEYTDLYPEKLTSKSYRFDGLEKHMEGAYRPGHFDGVATVVQSLFEKLSPNRAYFGEKDFQQLQIIKALVVQLDLKIEVVSCPIIREDDGLAMSSRNALLSPKERKAASEIYKALQVIQSNKTAWDASKMSHYFKTKVEEKPEMTVDYFFIAKTTDLIPVQSLERETSYRIFVAVYTGKTRLIDTVELGIM